MKLCVSSAINSIREDGSLIPFAETLEFMKRAGFEEMDLDITTLMMLDNEWERCFKSKVEEASAAGIRVRYAHLPFDYPNKSNVYGWEEFYTASCRAVDMAVYAGVDCAAIHPRSVCKTDYSLEKEHVAAKEFLSPYCEYAKQAGLMLALENMRGAGRKASPEIKRYCTQVTDLIQLADELGIGICWDTGHGNISGQGQLESLRLIGKRLKMVHINDNWGEDDIHTAPFLGNICWTEVAQGLKEIVFCGSLNLEVGCNRLPDKLRETYANYMALSAQRLADMMAN